MFVIGIVYKPESLNYSVEKVLALYFDLQIMAPKIERLVEIESLEAGKGPFWDSETQSLYLVDIFGHYIHKYVPSTKKHTKARVGKNISLVIPVEGKDDQFVISIERELLLITWDGESEEISIVEKLYEVDENTTNFFSDGKCDPSGRLWSGTLAQMTEDGRFEDNQCNFFSFQNKKITKHLSKVGLSSGLAFEVNLKKFYHVDSLKGTLDQYDFDIKTGKISNRKTIYTLGKEKQAKLSVLDGMTIDTDGNLWVAVFGESEVLKIDPRKPETIAETIQFPAEQITSVTFGGPNLDELYVTSSRITLETAVKTFTPQTAETGSTFRVTGLNAKGHPDIRVVL